MCHIICRAEEAAKDVASWVNYAIQVGFAVFDLAGAFMLNAVYSRQH